MDYDKYYFIFSSHVWCAYITFVKHKTVVFSTTSCKQYVSMLYYNVPDKFHYVFYKMPKNWKPFFALLSFVMVFVIPVSRVILVFEWSMDLLRVKIPYYYAFRRMLPLERIDLWTAMVLAVILLLYWHIREYKICMKQLENKGPL